MVKLSEPQQLQRSVIAKKRGAVMTRTSLGVRFFSFNNGPLLLRAGLLQSSPRAWPLFMRAHCFNKVGFCFFTARTDSFKQQHIAGHDKSLCFPSHLIMEKCLRHSPAGPSLHSHADVYHNAAAECESDVVT